MKNQTLYLSLITVVAGLGPPVASSAAPIEASGLWDDCNFAPDVRGAGLNIIVNVGITQNFSGTLDGKYVGTERDVVNADGKATLYGSGVFTGSVAGQLGTASYRYEGIVPAGDKKARLNWVLIGMTGALAKVNGQGTFAGALTGVSGECDAGTYAGAYTGAVNVRP